MTEQLPLTSADLSFHEPTTDHSWWTETAWFTFDQPGRNLSATFYPLFRRNLGICSLAVYVWDASAIEPWRIPYARFLWHLPFPTGDLRELEIAGLRYHCDEDFRRYRVRFHDEGRLDVDLTYEALREPWLASKSERGGHYDLPCSVTGTVILGDERIDVDCLGMHDRTWSVRPDDRKGNGTGYSFGNASGDDQFLVVANLNGNEGTTASGVFSGYLVRDGRAARLKDASRQVVERTDGAPSVVELGATDELGRSLAVIGRALNRFANHATPGTFTWMSAFDWESDGLRYVGQDQENLNLDLVGPHFMSLEEELR
ncbi:MAG: hypothetical protein WBA45_11380 [Microthrixaceae bacterium]